MTSSAPRDHDEDGETAGPLDGVRVLDLTRILAGPTATQLLGDYGADVIKVERAGAGDDTRRWGPPFLKARDGADSAESAYFLAANRNKRSIGVDFAKPEDRALLRELARRSDVLIENFKPGGLERHGLDWPSLRAINPRLVYCSITGFGQSGPNAHRPGYDLLAQAYGGIMSLTGEPDGEPMKVGVGVADVVCGLYAVTAILAALRHVERTGEGQQIDIALIDSQIAWLVNEATNYLVSGEVPLRRGNGHPNIVPYQVFEAADGHLVIAAGNDGQFERLCAILGVEELARDPRYASNSARTVHRESLLPVIAQKVRAWRKDTLCRALEEASIPGGPINRLDEVFESDQVAARAMKIAMAHPIAGEIELVGNPVKFEATEVRYRRPPPLLDEHRAEIEAELAADLTRPRS